MITKTWYKYLTFETIKSFLFFFISACLIFCIVDYPTQPFHKHNIPFSILSIYYSCQISYRAEILVPLCFMLASLKVMCTSNTNREFVALLAGGIKKISLTLPFIIIATFCILFSYYNFEYLYPKSMAWIDQFREDYLDKTSKSKLNDNSIHSVQMQDGSTLVYKKYNSKNKVIADAYWIKSINEMYKIKSLDLSSQIPTGHFVNHFSRNNNEEMQTQESIEKKTFENMNFSKNDLYNITVPIKHRSLSRLWTQQKGSTKDQQDKITTTLYTKLTLPLINILIILGITPFCLRFHKKLPIFKIFTLSLLAFVIILTTINAMSILGINNIISPIKATLMPIGIFSLLGGIVFLRVLK